MTSKKMKILHLIPTLSSGGAERQLVNLVTSTSKESFDHVVCVINNSDFFAGDIRRAGYKVIDLKISAKRPFFQAASAFRKIIKEEKPDVIHSWLYDANVSARIGNLGSGKIPIVTSLQLADYEPEAAIIGNWNPHKVRALKAIDKMTAVMTKPYFVPCSQFVKDSYKTFYGLDEAKTEVIFNSFSSEILKVSEADVEKVAVEFSFPQDTFVFLNVGRLDPQKNHKLIFDAFRQVLTEIPNAVLLLAGIGGLEDQLKKYVAELKIEEKVYFLGRRSDVGALLEFADVFVFPSFFEGLPVALVEAMFKSLPCIASRIKVFEEVLTDGETGLLIDPNNAVELKEAMIELYNDGSLRKKLGENAFREANEKYDIAVTAKEWENFYLKVKGKV
ncbi:MAG TPA: glycosyltransferase [Pyrinomonadaceae bacterium]|nr:glycosyltransferase [Pyrinomonadaceae bacterium]